MNQHQKLTVAGFTGLATIPASPDTSEALTAEASAGAMVSNAASAFEPLDAGGYYTVKCTAPVEHERERFISLRDSYWAFMAVQNLLEADRVKEEMDAIEQVEVWTDTVHNLVTTVGKNNILDNHLSGSGYTAAWFIGLISNVSYTTGPAVGDTMASHGGWTESVAYSNGARVTPSFSAASGGSKTLSTGAVFNINATDTIKGCFLNSVSTKGGTTGTLYSAGLFTGGDQPVVNGNTLTVTYTATV